MPAPLASRADRGVGAFGLCRNEDGLIPSIEGVAFGLLPRKDRGSSPKNPPTMSSSAPKVGVCSIGELAANIDGVRPIPPRSTSARAEPGRLRADAGWLRPPPPAERCPTAPTGRELGGRCCSMSSPRCFGTCPDPLLPCVERIILMVERRPPRQERDVDGGPSRSFIHGEASDRPGLMPLPSRSSPVPKISSAPRCPLALREETERTDAGRAFADFAEGGTMTPLPFFFSFVMMGAGRGEGFFDIGLFLMSVPSLGDVEPVLALPVDLAAAAPRALGLLCGGSGGGRSINFFWSSALISFRMPSDLRCSVEYQWFLIELSVRPGRSLAISVQRLPKRR